MKAGDVTDTFELALHQATVMPWLWRLRHAADARGGTGGPAPLPTTRSRAD
jgi:hypothetical protein